MHAPDDAARRRQAQPAAKGLPCRIELTEIHRHQAKRGVQDMLQVGEAILSCGLFLIAGIAGLVVRGYLPERHRDRDTLDFVRLAVGALVTFLAIVLGLLTASSKAHFDEISDSYRRMAAELTLLDSQLREVGDATAPIRVEMRAYLAAVIASTWPSEPAPSGNYLRDLPPGQVESAALTDLLRHIEAQILALQQQHPQQASLLSVVMSHFGAFTHARWGVIETEHPTIPQAFYALMLFWTALMFMGFGLCAPRNRVVAVTVLICAVSLASVIYVILELDDPSRGLIAISSSPLRDALADMDRT
jgi:hypothetical protein